MGRPLVRREFFAGLLALGLCAGCVLDGDARIAAPQLAQASGLDRIEATVLGME